MYVWEPTVIVSDWQTRFATDVVKRAAYSRNYFPNLNRPEWIRNQHLDVSFYWTEFPIRIYMNYQAKCNIRLSGHQRYMSLEWIYNNSWVLIIFIHFVAVITNSDYYRGGVNKYVVIGIAKCSVLVKWCKLPFYNPPFIFMNKLRFQIKGNFLISIYIPLILFVRFYILNNNNDSCSLTFSIRICIAFEFGLHLSYSNQSGKRIGVRSFCLVALY